MQHPSDYDQQLWDILKVRISPDLCEVVLRYMGVDLRFIRRRRLLHAHMPPDICRIVLEYTSGILGKRIWTTQFSCGPIYTIAVSPDGLVIVGSWEGQLSVWNPETQAIIRTLHGHTSRTVALLYMASGVLVSVSGGMDMRVWNWRDGVCVRTINLPALPFSLAEWEGKVIVGSFDGAVQIWDIERGAWLLTLIGHRAPVTSVAVWPSLLASRPSLLASSSIDRTIRVRDLKSVVDATGDTRIETTYLVVLEGHTDRVNSLVWQLDGNLASCSADRTIRQWDPNAGTCVRVLDGYPTEVKCIAMLGELLVSTFLNGIMIVYAKDGTQVHVLDQNTTVCWVVTRPEEIYTLNHSNEVQKIQ
jgi:WD40 repeat protein